MCSDSTRICFFLVTGRRDLDCTTSCSFYSSGLDGGGVSVLRGTLLGEIQLPAYFELSFDYLLGTITDAWYGDGDPLNVLALIDQEGNPLLSVDTTGPGFAELVVSYNGVRVSEPAALELPVLGGTEWTAITLRYTAEGLSMKSSFSGQITTADVSAHGPLVSALGAVLYASYSPQSSAGGYIRNIRMEGQLALITA